jgi:hypothetical protein
MMTFRELLADISASMARNEADVARAAEKAAAYKGPWRRKTDAVDVQARKVPALPVADPLALHGPEELA